MRRWICKLRGKHWWRYYSGHEYHCRVCGAIAPVRVGNIGRPGGPHIGGYVIDFEVKP